MTDRFTPDNVTFLYGAQPDVTEPPSPSEIIWAVARVALVFGFLFWMVGLIFNLLAGMFESRAIADSIALTVPWAVIGVLLGATASLWALWWHHR